MDELFITYMGGVLMGAVAGYIVAKLEKSDEH